MQGGDDFAEYWPYQGPLRTEGRGQRPEARPLEKGLPGPRVWFSHGGTLSEVRPTLPFSGGCRVRSWLPGPQVLCSRFPPGPLATWFE